MFAAASVVVVAGCHDDDDDDRRQSSCREKRTKGDVFAVHKEANCRVRCTRSQGASQKAETRVAHEDKNVVKPPAARCAGWDHPGEDVKR